MRTTLRASIAALASVAALAVSAAASGTPVSPGQPPRAEGTSEGSLVAGECAPGYPDCVDVIVDPDGGQSEPGYAGGGEPGSTGSAGTPLPVPPGSDDEIPCGVLIEGEDGTVSYRMCPGDPGLEPEPIPGLEPEPIPVPTVVEPRPGMVGVHPISFAGGSAYVSPDDPTVVIVDYWSGIEPCYVLDHVDVVETGNAVTITLFEGSDPAADAVACIEIGVFKRVFVSLDSPLGDRRIVDGAAA